VWIKVRLRRPGRWRLADDELGVPREEAEPERFE